MPQSRGTWEKDARLRTRTTLGRGRITDKIIASAKQLGDMDALFYLLGGLNSSNFRMEVLDVIFHHLDPETLRPPEVPPQFQMTATSYIQETMRDRANCAILAATQGLVGILFSHNQPTLPQAVAQKIILHLDDSMLWLKFLLANPFPVEPADPVQLADPTSPCEVLSELCNVGASLRRHICASPAVVDYCVAAWSAPNPHTGESFYEFSADGCPIARIFRKLLWDEDGADRIFYLLSLPGSKGRAVRAGVLYGVVSRCKQISSLSREEVERQFQATKSPRTTSTNSLENLFLHLELTLQVARKLWVNAEMARVLLKSTFLEDFLHGLQTWLLEKSDREKDRKARQAGFALLAKTALFLAELLKKLGLRYRKLCGGAWQRVFQSGYLPLLLEGIRSLPATVKEETSLILMFLDGLESACGQFPGCGVQAASELVSLLGDEYWEVEESSHHGWDLFWSVSLDVAAAAMTLTEPRYFICDNILCPRSPSASESKRVCSSCHAVLYCSQGCQEADWEENHRWECELRVHDSAKVGQIPGGANSYRQSLRHYHAQLAAHRAYVELCQNPRLRQLTDSEPSIILMGFGPFGKPREGPADLYPAYRFQRRSQDQSPPYADDFLKERIHALAEIYVDSKFAEGCRLVEVEYALGSQNLKVVSMFRVNEGVTYDLAETVKNGREPCTVLYSVAGTRGDAKDR